MYKAISLRLNKDETLTLRVGRSVEHIGTDAKSKSGIYDVVKYAAISKDIILSDADLTELLRRAHEERSSR